MAQGHISRKQLLQLAPELAKTLNRTQEEVDTALAGALSSLTDPIEVRHKVNDQGFTCTFALQHKCRYIGCHRKTCGLCINNPRKSCLRQLDTKYIVSDTLRAPCGAELYLQLHGCNEAEGAMDWTMPNNLHAQVSVIDARAYQAACKTIHAQLDDPVEDLLADHTLRVTREGKPLLHAEGMNMTEDIKLQVPLNSATTILPEISFQDSSEALLLDQKGRQVRLFMKVTGSEESCSEGLSLLTEEFVVTNHRSNLRKPEVPLTTDPVSKLQIIGKETVAKLRDLGAALASAHHEDVQVLEDYVHDTNSVRTVQDFVQLLDWCETDLQRIKALQRVLKLIRGWDTAAAHARSAVPEDNRPRFFTTASDVVLKYSCKLGNINFNRVTGTSSLTADELAQVELQARQQWDAPGHPGWSLDSPHSPPRTPASTVDTAAAQRAVVGSSLPQGCLWSNALHACTSRPEANQALPHLNREPSEGQLEQAAALPAADVSGCMPVPGGLPMLESMPADRISRGVDPQILRLLQHMQQQLPEGLCSDAAALLSSQLTHETTSSQLPHFYPAQQRIYESTVSRQASPLSHSGHLTQSAHPLTHTLPLDAGHSDVREAVGGSQHLGFPTGSALLDLEALQQAHLPPLCRPPIAMQHALLQPSLGGAPEGSVMPRHGANSAPVLLAASASVLRRTSPQPLNPLHYAHASTNHHQQQQQQQHQLSVHVSPEPGDLDPNKPPA